jgi:hypothetical protein
VGVRRSSACAEHLASVRRAAINELIEGGIMMEKNAPDFSLEEPIFHV